MEPFEERTLFAVGLVAAYSSEDVLLTNNQVLHTAPTELRFRFTSNIDASTLQNGTANIQVTRGNDHILGNGNDVSVAAPYLGVTTTATDVILRFASPLVDDLYQVKIVGSGATPLKNTDGEAFNGGADLTMNFTLDLGAQVAAVVPQPVTRDAAGKLSQAVNQIEVYFNVQDPLSSSTATNPINYELIRTAGTESTTDDAIFNPASVTYDAATGKAVLTFSSGVLTTAGLYRLRVGNNDPLPLAPVTPTVGAAGSSFGTSANLGTIFPAAQGTQSVTVDGSIGGTPVNVLYPGGQGDVGAHDLPDIFQSHLLINRDTTGVVPVLYYNFKGDIGQVLGAPAYNSITEDQKDRVREIMSFYSHYLGVEIVENDLYGATIATGDPRAVDPFVVPGGVGGIAGGSMTPVFSTPPVRTGLAVMNAGVDWGRSEPGGGYFQTAMHEIGHLLGLGHTYELPGLTIMGSGEGNGDSAPSGEPVFPGDFDILLGQYLHPPVGNDIDVYKFTLARAGSLNLETFAERLRDYNSSLNPSQLDSVITVYSSTGTVIARNDDYYGDDPFLQFDIEAGTYYVAITSTGNDNFDPATGDTGAGGTTQGEYKLRLTFTPSTTTGIKDTTGTALDGDADGTPGGNYNFWFRVASTANTKFVDKAATGGTGAAGSITNPYKTIDQALAAAAAGSVVRIVANGGADKDLSTVGDNLSYNIGFDNLGLALSDGSKFEIPRNVTVMVDAGAILKLRGANIDAGTVSQGIDHSGGALQLLGTPAKNASGADIGSVYVTSFYNTSIGTDSNPAKGPLTSGDWGGLVFREDSDLEDDGIFMNTVNRAKISYGGGQVVVNSVSSTFDPIHLIDARPTISFNTISNAANAAISANPNSFEESQFQGIEHVVDGSIVPGFTADYTRGGPKIYRNALSNNTISGLFVRRAHRYGYRRRDRSHDRARPLHHDRHGVRDRGKSGDRRFAGRILHRPERSLDGAHRADDWRSTRA